MNKTQPTYSVLLDCSFFIRLLNSDDTLHASAVSYFKYFIEHNIICKISTIAIAEYCVKGSIHDLPFEHLQIVPFNITDAEEAGKLCRIVFDEKKKRGSAFQQRAVIPNDTKMFAQANVLEDVKFFVSSDSEAKKIWSILKDSEKQTCFDYLDIHRPYTETFGILPLDSE
ncbi:MAG: hypothetical protein IJR13_06090 [Bacteroidales bacterium]|nr:hypothetical protein [Bacteroidales bacterium]